MPLVNHLTSTLLIHEPEDPIEFLVHQVEDIIHFRKHRGKPPILFNNDHLTNVFKGVDFLNKGAIDLSQYCSGEHTICIIIIIIIINIFYNNEKS